MAPIAPNQLSLQNPAPDSEVQLQGHVMLSQTNTGQINYYYEQINGYPQPVYQNQQGSQQQAGNHIPRNPIPVYGLGTNYGPLMTTDINEESVNSPYANNGPTFDHMLMRMNETERKLNFLLKKVDKLVDWKTSGPMQELRKNQHFLLTRINNLDNSKLQKWPTFSWIQFSDLTSIAVSIAKIACRNMGSQEGRRYSETMSSSIGNPDRDHLPGEHDTSGRPSLEDSNPEPRLNASSESSDKGWFNYLEFPGNPLGFQKLSLSSMRQVIMWLLKTVPVLNAVIPGHLGMRNRKPIWNPMFRNYPAKLLSRGTVNNQII